MRRFALLLIALLWTDDAWAHSTQSGAIKIGHVWADASRRDPDHLAIYLPIYNSALENDRLTDVTTPAGIVTLIHAGKESPPQIDLPGGKPISLNAKSSYLWLKDNGTFKPGDQIPLTFHFAGALPAKINALVETKPGH